MDLKMGVHHVGVVVDDIDEAKKFYENAFGWRSAGRFTVDAFHAEVCFLPAGNTYIELVRPLAEDGLGRFLKKHGPGTLHHVCYVVDDIDQAFFHLTREKGLRSATGVPCFTPCFEKAVFFHPHDTGNLLTEVVAGPVCRLPTP